MRFLPFEILSHSTHRRDAMPSQVAPHIDLIRCTRSARQNTSFVLCRDIGLARSPKPPFTSEERDSSAVWHLQHLGRRTCLFSPAFPILRRPWRSVRSPFRELARPTACVRADPDMRVHACSVTSSESKIYACPSLPIRRRTLAFLRLRDGLHPRVLGTQWTGLETCVLNGA